MKKFKLLFWIRSRSKNFFYVCLSFLVVEGLLPVPVNHVVLVLAAIARITGRNNVRQQIWTSLTDRHNMLNFKL